MKALCVLIAMILLVFLPHCGFLDDASKSEIQYVFDELWTAGFSDYPAGQEAFFELDSGVRPLPMPLDTTKQSAMISGNNHSDDLFMFYKRRVEGFKANTAYRLTFKVKFASQYPENSFGIGGSPGASVYLKAGATTAEPRVVPDQGFCRLNLDKGNQASGGADLVVLGSIGIAGDDFVYTEITRTSGGTAFELVTDATGGFWLIVGTDSGFEGTTTIYYIELIVKVKS